MHKNKRRYRRSGALAVAIAIAVLGAAIIGSNASAKVTEPSSEAAPQSALAGCVGGVVCAWTTEGFVGEASWFGCSVEQTVFLEFLSAKNHCGTNMDIGWKEGGSTNWKACMAPNGERPSPGRFNTVKPGC
jgi:hypothetical protein